MPTPTFKRISLEQFTQLLARFPFTRQINAVHMHHTWRPSRADFAGHQTIVGMWRYHTEQLGWRDIAQHISIDPEGFIWLGRNWNMPPASAAGHNGNEKFGPFMFEMIGNFDKGFDPFDGAQRETALQVIAQVQSRFDLATNTLMFHNAMSSKTCPGNSLDHAEICAEVEKRRVARGEPVQASKAASPEPFPYERDIEINDAIQALSRTPARGMESADAELLYRPDMPERVLGDAYGEVMERQTGAELARDSGLSAATLAALRPHLVNLAQGRFSDEGEVSTTPADVDAIFEQHLPKALEEAKANGNKLRLMFYAHGGLVSESSGLQIAAKHIQWWRQNDVYPIYFIWETGLFETLGQLLRQARQDTTRGLARDIFDHTIDPLIEVAARTLQGPRIWGGMKSSAEHAVDEPTESNPSGGGARYVAVKLKQFCDANKGDMELHAAGHSAGSIFHSYFLPVVNELKIPTFTSLHFLAPAVRVDTFKEQLADLIGDRKAAQKLTVFTMKKDFEKDDNCARIYHKSLLYLVHSALEDKRSTPILGLEESLRGDADLKTLFGLDGTRSVLGEVVWSVTPGDTGASASTSQSHGGFDDDAPTMNSMARRVLGKADADKIVEYSGTREIAPSISTWTKEVDWAEGLGLTTPATTPAPPQTQEGYGKLSSAAASQGYKPGLATSTGAGRRFALCVGINRYPNPQHQLAGCVADAQMWSETLTRIGFTTSMLLDQQATREAIERELLSLVGNSQPGDVIVFQYSGHGTNVPDLNGIEEDAKDEALCPVDFATGALFIDDDIAQVFARVPAGVNMTCFMDCCHSGTNTRFAVGAPMAGLSRGRDERKRFVVPTPEIVAAHTRFRQRMGGIKRAIGTGGPGLMKNISFAACQDSEVAWESDGHGEFTLQATRVLIEGIENVSNDQFTQRVIARFGMQARQHPMLDCSPEVVSRALLQPWVRAGEALLVQPAAPAISTGMGMGVDQALLAQLNQIETSIQQLRTQLAAR